MSQACKAATEPTLARVDLFLIDDASQRSPSRDGMGPMVGVGGLHVPSASVRQLERDLDALCARFGFPAGEEFKWSPERKAWMHANLRYDARRDFFLAGLGLAAKANTTAIVVAEDANRGRARRTSPTAEDDVVAMFLERADNLLAAIGNEALLVFDQPHGGRKRESAFLAGCMETISAGTAFTSMRRLALALSSDSKLVRLLQLADVVASCTLARVAGEATYSPPVFEAIRPLLRSQGGQVGGYGLKLHPDFCFMNLYYWLVGDERHDKARRGGVLPAPARQYHQSEDVARPTA
jgi:hypothetical protein